MSIKWAQIQKKLKDLCYRGAFVTRKENRRTVKYSGELTHMYVHQYIFPVHWGKIQIFLVFTAMSKHFVNVTATRVGWLLNGMCSSKKYPYPPPPGISIQGVLVITCPLPRTLIILFVSWRQLLHKLLCKPWKMQSTELKQKIADEKQCFLWNID